MAINSALFVGFLAAVCLTAYLVPRKFRYIWLLVCSYGFYLYSPSDFTKNLPALALMLVCTLLSYLCALGMARAHSVFLRRIFLVVSLAGCLGILMACKYTNFFLSTTGIARANFVLPLGISYYILQTVGYTIDVYTNVQKPEKNPIRYALFVSFFPGLVTGPINRASEMLPQYRAPAKFNYAQVSGGLFRVLWGIFKKMVIADNLSVFTAGVFDELERRSGPLVILAVLLFAYQLYMDFSGCGDIAIGAARMLGFRFTENFKRPFAAKTFPGLWQRWHISLTSFLRDYVFTPLVWSRWTEKLPFIGKFFSKPPMLSGTLFVFALSGLWHGTNINYIYWGMLNGLFMVGSQLIGKKREKLINKIPVYRNKHLRGFIQRIVVYLMFSLCLVFFSAAVFKTDLALWFSRLGVDWITLSNGKFMTTLGHLGLDTRMLILLGAAILLVEFLEKFGIKKNSTMAEWIRKRNIFVRWGLYILLLVLLLFFGAFGRSAFIYAQY